MGWWSTHALGARSRLSFVRGVLSARKLRGPRLCLSPTTCLSYPVAGWLEMRFSVWGYLGLSLLHHPALTLAQDPLPGTVARANDQSLRGVLASFSTWHQGRERLRLLLLKGKVYTGPGQLSYSLVFTRWPPFPEVIFCLLAVPILSIKAILLMEFILPSGN